MYNFVSLIRNYWHILETEIIIGYCWYCYLFTFSETCYYLNAYIGFVSIFLYYYYDSNDLWTTFSLYMNMLWYIITIVKSFIMWTNTSDDDNYIYSSFSELSREPKIILHKYWCLMLSHNQEVFFEIKNWLDIEILEYHQKIY